MPRRVCWLDPIDPAYRSYCPASSSTYSCPLHHLFGESVGGTTLANTSQSSGVSRLWWAYFSPHYPAFRRPALLTTSICQQCKCKFVPNGTLSKSFRWRVYFRCEIMRHTSIWPRWATNHLASWFLYLIMVQFLCISLERHRKQMVELCTQYLELCIPIYFLFKI